MANIFSSLGTVLITVFIFGLLIFVHELGHYISARKFKVGIIEFAIGMGPKIYSWEGKYNLFSVRLLPFGGFVNMVGEYDDKLESKDEGKTPISEIKVWKRIVICLVGPMFNLLFGFLIMSVIVATSSRIGSTKIESFIPGNASSAWLAENDEIISINGKKINVYTDLSYKILTDGIEPVQITVLRNGEKLTLRDVKFHTETDKNVLFGSVDFRVYFKEKTVGTLVYESFYQSYSTLYMTLDSLADTIKGRYGLDAVSGPVGIGSEIGNVIEESKNQGQGLTGIIRNLSSLTVFISISLGLFNLLPIPVMDGGRILFYIVEIIRRKPMNKNVEATISAVFMALLLMLTAVILFKDIANLF